MSHLYIIPLWRKPLARGGGFEKAVRTPEINVAWVTTFHPVIRKDHVCAPSIQPPVNITLTSPFVPLLDTARPSAGLRGQHLGFIYLHGHPYDIFSRGPLRTVPNFKPRVRHAVPALGVKAWPDLNPHL